MGTKNSDKGLRIGFQILETVSGGPKVFLSRLRDALQERGLFDEENFNVWINLSYKPIPSRVTKLRRLGKVKVILRCDGAWNMDVVPLLLGRKCKILNGPVNGPFNALLNRYYYLNFRKTDLIVYQSRFCQFCVEHFVYKPHTRSVIVNNGVDLSQFQPSETMLKKNTLDILISHRIQPVKRVQQAPSLIERLREKYPNVRVHIVGEGVRNTLDEIKKIVDRKGLNKHFLFYGHKDPSLLPSVFAKCDFMLCLSYLDPCPNSVVEALACGLPVLAPASGGVRDIIGDAGYIVDEGIDEQDYNVYWHFNSMPQIPVDRYVEGVEYIVNNMDVLRNKARRRAEECFDIERVVDKYIEVAESILDW